ncbi:hypothetical protein C8Q79DRAFT_979018 [Trametes meyenii]|nr:hypothetical protein C8Q79DRAFT_979018 [Trametes meyenii]
MPAPLVVDLRPSATTPPIHRLHNELLLEIFTHVRASEFADHEWYKLLWVCRFWANIARGSPVFWRSLSITGEWDFTWQTHVFSVGLACSGSIPIDITISGTHPEQNAVVRALLLPHVSRIRALCISSMEETRDPALRALLHQKMPALRELEVQFKTKTRPLGRYQNQVPPEARVNKPRFLWNLDRSQFPALSRLYIGDAVSLSGSIPIFSKLKRIAISNCEAVAPSTIIEFTNFLAAHPNLEELYVSRYRPTITDMAQRLQLPTTLRKFTINDNAYYTAPFLSLFRFPADLDVKIVRALDREDFGDVEEMGFAHRHAINVQQALPTNRSVVLPILSLVDSIEAEHCRRERYILTGRTPSGHTISLEVRVAEYGSHRFRTYHSFSDLVDIFRGAPAVRLSLKGSYLTKVSKSQWQNALRAFPFLEEIEIARTDSWSEYDPRLTLFKVLQQPRTQRKHRAKTPGESDGHTILSRHLRTLVFASAADHNEDEALADTLAACLESREEACVPIKRVHLRLEHCTQPGGAYEMEDNNARRVEVYTEALHSLMRDLQIDVVNTFKCP